MPDGVHVSDSARAYYRDMFRAFKDRGIELFAVLYWFDIPLARGERGGFSKHEIEDDFVAYCDTCFKLFDGLVDVWYVYNEPTVDTYHKYAWEACYPNRVSWEDVCLATYNMVVAHARVVRAFREGGYAGKIGSVVAYAHVHPRSDGPDDVRAAEEDAALVHKSFEDPFMAGRLNPLWLDIVERSGVRLDRREGDGDVLATGVIDVIGLNVYMPERVKAADAPMIGTAWMCQALDASAGMCSGCCEEAPGDVPVIFASAYENPNAVMNKDRGWEIYPRVMYDTLMDIKRDYPGMECRITENGMGAQREGRYRDGSGMIQDDYRIEYIHDHLVWAHRAIRDGANLTAYNAWSFVDLWSPFNQFKNCCGFLEYDRESGDVRLKKSREWFKGVTERNDIEG